MEIIKDHIISGASRKSISLDMLYETNHIRKPIIIFLHGFKGFKDWGAFNQMASFFALQGFIFIKFNFSHNGITAEDPSNIKDLEAFSLNTYTKELEDLKRVIDFVEQDNMIPKKEKNTNEIYLIGHSRGGGITTIKASEDQRIKKVVTLAGVSDYASRFPQADDPHLKIWRENQTVYIKNSRTNQKLPLNYIFYEDFKENEERLNIQKACEKLTIPFLIIHGYQDTTVEIKEAENLHRWLENSIYIIIKNANHTFNVTHPWKEKNFSKEFTLAIEAMKKFFEQSIPYDKSLNII